VAIRKFCKSNTPLLGLGGVIPSGKQIWTLLIQTSCSTKNQLDLFTHLAIIYQHTDTQNYHNYYCHHYYHIPLMAFLKDNLGKPVTEM